jgi:predicted DNA-binding ArsR family transcriptional regulator
MNITCNLENVLAKILTAVQASHDEIEDCIESLQASYKETLDHIEASYKETQECIEANYKMNSVRTDEDRP